MMDILLKFPERLADLMEERDLTPMTLSKLANINYSTVTRYLNGARLPSFETFIRLLEIFGCSADYMIGLQNDPMFAMQFLPAPPFYERFAYLLKEKRISQYALHKLTGFSYDNFNKWLKGTTSPYLDNLVKLAKAFDCCVDSLLGRIE